jgi:hypothetical protein
MPSTRPSSGTALMTRRAAGERGAPPPRAAPRRAGARTGPRAGRPGAFLGAPRRAPATAGRPPTPTRAAAPTRRPTRRRAARGTRARGARPGVRAWLCVPTVPLIMVPPPAPRAPRPLHAAAPAAQKKTLPDQWARIHSQWRYARGLLCYVGPPTHTLRHILWPVAAVMAVCVGIKLADGKVTWQLDQYNNYAVLFRYSSFVLSLLLAYRANRTCAAPRLGGGGVGGVAPRLGGGLAAAAAGRAWGARLAGASDCSGRRAMRRGGALPVVMRGAGIRFEPAPSANKPAPQVRPLVGGALRVWRHRRQHRQRRAPGGDVVRRRRARAPGPCGRGLPRVLDSGARLQRPGRSLAPAAGGGGAPCRALQRRSAALWLNPAPARPPARPFCPPPPPPTTVPEVGHVRGLRHRAAHQQHAKGGAAPGGAPMQGTPLQRPLVVEPACTRRQLPATPSGAPRGPPHTPPRAAATTAPSPAKKTRSPTRA